jgi:hypothetical protein
MCTGQDNRDALLFGLYSRVLLQANVFSVYILHGITVDGRSGAFNARRGTAVVFVGARRSRLGTGMMRTRMGMMRRMVRRRRRRRRRRRIRFARLCMLRCLEKKINVTITHTYTK